MRATLFLIIAFWYSIAFVKGQTIPNAGFEDWRPSMVGYKPFGWNTNITQNTHPVIMDSNAYKGDVAVAFIRKYGGPFGAGVAESKFPFSIHPEKLLFYAKSEIDGTDTNKMVARVFFEGKKVDSGIWINTNSIPEWELQSLNITQLSTNCDSLEIIINGGSNWNTSFSIDELDYTIKTTINGYFLKSNWHVYPSPVANALHIQNIGKSILAKNFTIYNEVGKVVRKGTISYDFTIDVSILNPGIYFFSIDGEELKTKKFIKK